MEGELKKTDVDVDEADGEEDDDLFEGEDGEAFDPNPEFDVDEIDAEGEEGDADEDGEELDMEDEDVRRKLAKWSRAGAEEEEDAEADVDDEDEDDEAAAERAAFGSDEDEEMDAAPRARGKGRGAAVDDDSEEDEDDDFLFASSDDEAPSTNKKGAGKKRGAARDDVDEDVAEGASPFADASDFANILESAHQDGVHSKLVSGQAHARTGSDRTGNARRVPHRERVLCALYVVAACCRLLGRLVTLLLHRFVASPSMLLLHDPTRTRIPANEKQSNRGTNGQ